MACWVTSNKKNTYFCLATTRIFQLSLLNEVRESEWMSEWESLLGAAVALMCNSCRGSTGMLHHWSFTAAHVAVCSYAGAWTAVGDGPDSFFFSQEKTVTMFFFPFHLIKKSHFKLKPWIRRVKIRLPLSCARYCAQYVRHYIQEL